MPQRLRRSRSPSAAETRRTPPQRSRPGWCSPAPISPSDKHVAADVGRYDLTASEFGILEALFHKGPLLLGDLQKKILVTSGGVTYLVNRLIAKGLVTRESFPGDKRSRFAVLTPKGSALIKQIFPGHAKRIAKAMGALSSKEQKRLTAMLRTLGKGA